MDFRWTFQFSCSHFALLITTSLPISEQGAKAPLLHWWDHTSNVLPFLSTSIDKLGIYRVCKYLEMICICWVPHCIMNCMFLTQESVSFPLSAHRRYTSPTQVQNRSSFFQVIRNIWKFISLLTKGGMCPVGATRLVGKTNKSLGWGLQRWHSLTNSTREELPFTWPSASL